MSALNFDKLFVGAIPEGETGPVGLFQKCYNGAVMAVSYAEILLNRALAKSGPEQPVSYPNTGYFLPVFMALSGEQITKLGEIPPVLNRMRAQVKPVFTFEQARLNGEATLYAAEVIEIINYLEGNNPQAEPWTGFLEDPVFRQYGIKMVDWTIPGVAIIIGRAKDSKLAAKIVGSLMSQGMMLFLCDEVVEQLLEENVKLGIDYIAFPVGNFTQVVHAVNYALRAGMAFGGIAPGAREEARDYQRRRVMAFVLHLGELDEVKVAAEFGAIFLGFPVLTDQELGPELELPDWYVSHPNYDTLVRDALELRGVKLTAIEVDIPVNFGPAFEGETIRKKDTYVEFGGGHSPAFELVRSVGSETIEDGRIMVVGPTLDQMREGEKHPLGIMVDIYGRKMQVDFEPVLERRIHYFANYAEGLWHVAQRDLCWVRIAKDAQAKGFQLEDIGKILIAKYKADFPSIVDRVQVTILTDEQAVTDNIQLARQYYRERDDRMRGLTDEAVEEFYSCILCQSFAPNHVCVVTPERVGLCGAVTWLDAKASYQINALGPNRIIEKGPALDPEKGSWQSVNDYVAVTSNGAMEEVCLYTLNEAPMTSCGCFEAIMCIVPEANGVCITTREHAGMTPVGMTFSTLAGMIGGGVQTPGFMGIGKSYIVSRKFIPADGGLARIIWMPKALKEFLREDFVARSHEENLGDDFIDKIADETIGISIDEVLPFLEEKEHPALMMDSIL